ncbi:MAG: DUF4974 domain-containing protein [Bacteroidales bacterium]|nr:DUF4974 domain-containing protein [Bacteroidales bacterium]HPM18192.1 DUF4974 domain-containing protein [Bacteroidales bacterium]
MDPSVNIEHIFLNLLEGGEISAEELKILHAWLESNPDEAEKYADFREIWALASVPENMAESECREGYRQLEKRLRAKRWPVIRMEKQRRLRVPVLAAAVIAGMVIAIGALHLWDSRIIRKERFVVEVPAGSRSVTILPDGTKVTLNGDSKISYDQGYGRSNRNVDLSGEGYFEVVHNARHTFSVCAAGAMVAAHGTVFNVKAYPEDPSVETTLVKGSVSIEIPGHRKERMFLKPSEQFTWLKPVVADDSDKGRVLISKGIDTERYTSWISGRLIIQSELLADLSLRLERKYDVEISFEEQDLKNLRFTGVLEDETIEQVLEVLKITSNLDFKISGREIVLFSCRKTP